MQTTSFPRGKSREATYGFSDNIKCCNVGGPWQAATGMRTEAGKGGGDEEEKGKEMTREPAGLGPPLCLWWGGGERQRTHQRTCRIGPAISVGLEAEGGRQDKQRKDQGQNQGNCHIKQHFLFPVLPLLD